MSFCGLFESLDVERGQTPSPLTPSPQDELARTMQRCLDAFIIQWGLEEDHVEEDSEVNLGLQIPAKYNSQTELKQTLKPGRNSIDFAL